MSMLVAIYYLSPAGQRSAAKMGHSTESERRVRIKADDPVYDALIDRSIPSSDGDFFLPVGFKLVRRPDSVATREATDYVRMNRPIVTDQLIHYFDEPIGSAGTSFLQVLNRLDAEREAREEEMKRQSEEAQRRLEAAEFKRAAERYGETLDHLDRMRVHYLAELDVDGAIKEKITQVFRRLFGVPYAEAVKLDGFESMMNLRGVFDALHAMKRRGAEMLREQERDTWIAKYGSDHLRNLLRLGLERDHAYRAERITMERPGWTWAPPSLDDREPISPTPLAVTILEEARRTDPEARLRWDNNEHRFYVSGTFIGDPVVWRVWASRSATAGGVWPDPRGNTAD